MVEKADSDLRGLEGYWGRSARILTVPRLGCIGVSNHWRQVSEE